MCGEEEESILSRVAVPKYKVDRRLGVNLWGRPKSPFNTRSTKPGQHGRSTKKKRLSNYGLQLTEKQKLQFYYAMKEKQFRIFFVRAAKSRKDVAQVFIGMLESRLDAFVYRMKWTPTIFSAKQMIKHKHVLVNGKCVSVCSYLLQPKDIVSLKDAIKDHVLIKDSMALAEREVPAYYNVEHDGLSAEFIKAPSLDEVPYPVKVNPHLIVEYYSRKV